MGFGGVVGESFLSYAGGGLVWFGGLRIRHIVVKASCQSMFHFGCPVPVYRYEAS